MCCKQVSLRFIYRLRSIQLSMNKYCPVPCKTYLPPARYSFYTCLSVHRGVCLHGGLPTESSVCMGFCFKVGGGEVCLQGVCLLGEGWADPSLEPKKWAVRILLESGMLSCCLLKHVYLIICINVYCFNLLIIDLKIAIFVLVSVDVNI